MSSRQVRELVRADSAAHATLRAHYVKGTRQRARAPAHPSPRAHDRRPRRQRARPLRSTWRRRSCCAITTSSTGGWRHDRVRRLPATDRARRRAGGAHRARAAQPPSHLRAAGARRSRAARGAGGRAPQRARAGSRRASTPTSPATAWRRPDFMPSAGTTTATRRGWRRRPMRRPCCTSRGIPRGWPCCATSTPRRWRSSAPGAPGRRGSRSPAAWGAGSPRRASRSSAGWRSASTPPRTPVRLRSAGRRSASSPAAPTCPTRASKRGLYRAIVGTQAVVSEMPPGFQPFRWCFPARNRTIAGLASLTIVVEATERSGSLITAELAQDLGRPVGAVPGSVSVPARGGIQRAAARRGACHPPRPGRVGRGARHRRGDRARRPQLRRARRARCGRCCAASRTAATRSVASPRRPLRRSRSSWASPSSSCSASCAAGREDAMCDAPELEAVGEAPAGGAVAARVPGACRTAGRATYPRLRAQPPRARRPLDRGVGLRRRRGDPGRPQGVRVRRRARDDSDHGDHRAEHRARQRRAAGRRRDHRRAGACGRRPTSVSTR